MPSNIDKYRHADVPQVADLTWEVIEARGITTGDVMALWEVTREMATIAEDMLSECAARVSFEISNGNFEDAQIIKERYVFMIGYIKRDVQELCKFLVRRNFHFPEDEE